MVLYVYVGYIKVLVCISVLVSICNIKTVFTSSANLRGREDCQDGATELLKTALQKRMGAVTDTTSIFILSVGLREIYSK